MVHGPVVSASKSTDDNVWPLEEIGSSLFRLAIENHAYLSFQNQS